MANDELPPPPTLTVTGKEIVVPSSSADPTSAMTLALNSKNKLGFVNGSIKAPSEESDPEGYATWSRCKDMVHSWIVNTLSPEISDSVIYYSAAHEILFMNPLPSVRQVYSSVSQEEKQRLLSTTIVAIDSSSSPAMAVQSNNSGNRPIST
ncbi:hypothetical protein LWI28_027512 [Acer negundo]|uniref:Retrotransposon Copia-like N-terminal domain-containing protein n=1 Tax=Acer negundo TaxID=4023 RepID=A0AAD5NVV7_ACENE|nr:hypothetical protein LWI28_027512 [Acer negundo]